VTETPPEPNQGSAPRRRSLAAFRKSREWLVLVVVALVLSLVIRDFAFQTFFIPSGSMEPTLQVGDRIVVDKLSVRYGTINTGDVIVFHAPATVASVCGDADSDLVKRVIGVPFDTVSSTGNTIYINGHPLAEKWSHTEPLGPVIKTTRVPKNDYFVIGDNHSDSCDSRYWGFVPRQNIIGKVFVRLWPLRRIGWL